MIRFSITKGLYSRIDEIQNRANAKNVMKFAREHDWHLVLVQHLQQGSIFSNGSEYSDFISGFEPKAGESVYIKDNFSSFSSHDFCEVMNAHKESDIYVIGYGSTVCCLSTIIDGYHRGYKFNFISDASNAKPTTNLSSEVLHRSASEILKTFLRELADCLKVCNPNAK